MKIKLGGRNVKLLHLSDLHLGKNVNGFSMLEDQEYILSKIIDIADSEKPDVVVIAGDVYDKAVAPVAAVTLFDDFLFRLTERGITTIVISGNHDSAVRIAFGSRLLGQSGLYMSPVYTGDAAKVTINDEFGAVDIFLLPFIKPIQARLIFEDEEILSYTDALRAAVSRIETRPEHRSVIVTHQFVTGARRSDSEDVIVGGSENVDAAVFSGFDYVALGHIHRPQHVARKTVRYCGAPLKYSFSEADDDKSVTVVELAQKGSVTVRTVPLTPLRDMREIKGRYIQLASREFYRDMNTSDYFHVILTDEQDVPDAIGKLRAIYPNIMKLDYDNARTRSGAELSDVGEVKKIAPIELFERFYKIQNNQHISGCQRELVSELIEKIWGEQL